jgi:ATP-dependent Lon protease
MHLPEQVGVMLLPQTVLFPHQLLPLRIFEPRYRKMLQEALEGSRMFAVVMDSQTSSIPSRVGGLGLIRTCVQQADGTSNLILQGIARVRLDHVLKNRPFLIASPEPMNDPEESTPQFLATQESLVAKILEQIEKIDTPVTPALEEMKDFLKYLEDPHAFVDLVAGSFVKTPTTRQIILQTPRITERLRLLLSDLNHSL